MGHYAELYLALPSPRLPEIASQMGAPISSELVAAIAADADRFGLGATIIRELDELTGALSVLVSGAIPSVPSPFDHVTDGSSIFGIIMNDEGETRLGQVFVGIHLHSNYSDRGIAEAKAAAVGEGYVITPELLAAAEALRQQLVSLAPAFADALLVSYITHW